MENTNIYVEPKNVDFSECAFYHTSGDLRGTVSSYLGNVDLNGKRVLEMGTADGFLCFEMEKMKADVVAYDLSSDYDWDVVPFADLDVKATIMDRKKLILELNNAFWFCHKAYGSKAKKVHGTVYSVPLEIGPVDVATFGAILLHVRDPFLALYNACRITKEKVIVTEPIGKYLWIKRLLNKLFLYRFPGPYVRFIPRRKEDWQVWWTFSPLIIQRFIGVLGFLKTTVTYSRHKFTDKQGKLRYMPMFTIVGERTFGLEQVLKNNPVQIGRI